MSRHILIQAFTFSLISSGLLAGVVPGRWDKVAVLPEGEPIIVRLASGERLEVEFADVDDQQLRVTSESGALRFPIDHVTEVSREVADSTTNGTLIGTAAGFGIGFGATVAFEQSVTASGFRLEEENLGLAILGGLIGAGAGAVTGWAVDRSTKEKDVLYLAP